MWTLKTSTRKLFLYSGRNRPKSTRCKHLLWRGLRLRVGMDSLSVADNFPTDSEGQTPQLPPTTHTHTLTHNLPPIFLFFIFLLRTNISGGVCARCKHKCQEPMSHATGVGLPARRAKKVTTEAVCGKKQAAVCKTHKRARSHIPHMAICSC